MKNDPYYTRPLTHAELTTFREQRAIIPEARDNKPIVWGSSAERPHSLMSIYGSAGDIPAGSTSPRRRLLVA